MERQHNGLMKICSKTPIAVPHKSAMTVYYNLLGKRYRIHSTCRFRLLTDKGRYAAG